MVGETCWPDFENRIFLKYNFRAGWCAQSGIGASVNYSIFNESLMCVSQIEALCVLNCRPTVVRWQGYRARAIRRKGVLAARNASGSKTSRSGAEGHRGGRAVDAETSADAQHGPSGPARDALRHRGVGGAPGRRDAQLAQRRHPRALSSGDSARRLRELSRSPEAGPKRHAATAVRAHVPTGEHVGQPLRLEGTSIRPPKLSNIFAYPLQKRELDRKECCRTQPVESRCGETEI